MQKRLEGGTARLLQSHVEIAKAIGTQATLILSSNAAQHEESRTIIKNIERQQEEMLLAEQRRKLLDSLRFERMNEKVSRTKETHPETFKWILQPPSEASTLALDKIDVDHRSYLGRRWDDFPTWMESDSTLYWVGRGKCRIFFFASSLFFIRLRRLIASTVA